MLQNPLDLSVQQLVLPFQHPVTMAVSEQPAPVAGPLTDFLQKIRQFVSGPIQNSREAGGRAMGDDVIYRPIVGVQVPLGLGVFLCGRQFLRPPGDSFNSEYLPCPALEPILDLLRN